METAEPSILTVDLFGRARGSPQPDGFPRTARVAHSGRPSRRLHGPPAPGPRCEDGARTPGLRLNSRPRPRRGLTLPQRLVTLGGVGDGTAGRGRGSEPSGGRGSCSRENSHGDEKIRSEKEKLRRRRRGRGEKPGSGKRNRQGEGDLARPTNSRERALGSRDSRRPLSGRYLRPRKAGWVGPNGQEVACLGCARRRVPASLTSVPPCDVSGEWLASVGA